jgi:hypothetical protein
MPFVYMLAAIGVATLLRWLSTFKRDASVFAPARVASALALFVVIALPAWSAYASQPHYAMYTNALAASRAGYYFPHDEFYDDGLREALKFVAERAPKGATIVHETPGVARYYLHEFNRDDLKQHVLSDMQFKPDDATPPAYFLLQRGRTYFENQEEMDAVRARFPKVYESTVAGVVTVEVYEAK